MLVLNRSLLNREYILINVLKAGWGFSPSANRQLQHVGVEDVLPCLGHSLCR
jgi:hypothetical protein